MCCWGDRGVVVVEMTSMMIGWAGRVLEAVVLDEEFIGGEVVDLDGNLSINIFFCLVSEI